MRPQVLRWLLPTLILAIGSIGLLPTNAVAQTGCAAMPTAAELRTALVSAATGTGVDPVLGPGTDAGGIFGCARRWGAIVDRSGAVCVSTTSTTDPTQVWPVSQQISKAKAYTAN